MSRRGFLLAGGTDICRAVESGAADGIFRTTCRTGQRPLDGPTAARDNSGTPNTGKNLQRDPDASGGPGNGRWSPHKHRDDEGTVTIPDNRRCRRVMAKLGMDRRAGRGQWLPAGWILFRRNGTRRPMRGPCRTRSDDRRTGAGMPGVVNGMLGLSPPTLWALD